jgi:hypothetical protein
MAVVIIDRTLFDEVEKFVSDNGGLNTSLGLKLEAKRRELLEMNIDNTTKLIGNDAVEIINIVKTIMADKKITLGDVPEAWNLMIYIIKIAGKISSLKGELSNLSTEEIQYIVNECIELYQSIDKQKAAAKLVGPLPKV